MRRGPAAGGTRGLVLKKKTPDSAGERNRASEVEHSIPFARAPSPARRRPNMIASPTGESEMSPQRTDALRNREAVLDAALDLLAVCPAASMQDIADASELGRSTVYRHFPTRDELFSALQGVAVKHARDEAKMVLAAKAPFEETMHELSKTMLETGIRYRFMLSSEAAVARELQVARRLPGSPIRSYFEDCRESGEVRSDLPLDWMMASLQALSLVAMEDHRTGRRDLDDASRCLAESLIGILSPR